MHREVAVRIGVMDIGHEGWTGGRNYVELLVRALKEGGRERVEPVVISGADAGDRWKGLVESVTVANPGKRDAQPRFRFWSRPVENRIERYCRENGIEALLLQTAFTEAPAPFRRVAWIPDFQHHHLEGFFTREEVERRNRIFEQWVRYADQVMLSSGTALDHFRDLYPDFRHKGVVARFPSRYAYVPPAEPKEDIRSIYGLPEKYILVANQYWAHKNHKVVIDALAQLADEAITVVFTGLPLDGRDKQNRPVSDMLQDIAKLGLWGRVIPLGLVPIDHLTDLMRGACAVIQPSRFEGWSTVIQDALALGKPLICSDLPVHREQVPDALGFFEPGDAKGLAALIADHWNVLSADRDCGKESESLSAMREMADQYQRVVLGLCGVT